MTRSAKRTFQVAFYSAAGAGKRTTLRALHELLPKPGKSPFSEIPHGTSDPTTTMFFDYQPPVDRGLKATLRMRCVADDPDLSGQAFLSLISSNAVVFVVDAQRARRRDNTLAWREATKHFSTYGVSLDRLPLVIQLTKLDRPKPVRVAEVRRQLRLPNATCVETNPRTGCGLDELARAVERQVFDAFHEGRVQGQRTTMPSSKYLERAAALATATDIATSLQRSGKRWNLSIKQMSLHPELGFATLRSLASLESSFFTCWNESAGAKVDAFWREVAQRRLPFHRRDVVREALARGRITNREDYEIVIDWLGDAQFSAAQNKKLAAMISAYEKAVSRERPR